jgi:hypothetical protein
MKTKALGSLLAVLALSGSLTNASPLGSAFTYQGRLNDGANAANNLYDLDFTLFDVPVGGSQLGLSVTYSGYPISNGLFTVTLDFGATPFNGADRWLQIQVRTNGGRTPPPWTLLSPRQPLTPLPYALYAPSAGSAVTASNVAPLSVTAGSIAEGAITAGKLASGQVVKSLNGLSDVVTLSAGTNVTLATSGNDLKISATPGTVVTNAGWGISGNSGTTSANFLGTTDGQPLELRVNGQRALRLEPNPSGAPNVVVGASVNQAGPGIVGATIAGGGASSYQGGAYTNRVDGDFGTIAGGVANVIEVGAHSTISGGYGNTVKADAHDATIGGGMLNSIQTYAYFSFLGGGYMNRIQPLAKSSFLGGGYENIIQTNAAYSFLGGGEGNSIGAYASHAVIPGGRFNAVGNEATNAFAAGYRAKANHPGTFVWADRQEAGFASTGNNQFLIRASGGLGVNVTNPAYAADFGGRVRLRGSLATETAGLFIYDTARNADRSFIGQAGDGLVGFWGNAGAGWGLVMNITNGFVGIGTGVTPQALTVAGNVQANQFIGSGAGLSFDNTVWKTDGNAGTTSLHFLGTTDSQPLRIRAAGGMQLDNTTSLSFGNQVRQMINLFTSGATVSYGIGVQSSTLYFRTAGDQAGNGFAWYKGGVHADAAGSPGTGGTKLMSLDGSGNLTVPVLTITGGADVAEPFQMSGQDIPKGSVVIIDEDHPGQLKLSQYAYDSRVAGIVSGANGIQPGLSLSQQGVVEGGQQVALSGRVYVRADASQGAIKPGDLLTTSAIPGHAMKVTDHLRAQGAILGKAMSALKQGQGLVLVLVTLQ